MAPEGDTPLQAVVDQACNKLGIKAPFTWEDLPLETWLPAARVACLDEEELPSLPPDFPDSVVNPRNEAAALSLLVSHMAELCNVDTVGDLKAHLVHLCESYNQLVQSNGAGPTDEGIGVPFSESSPEASLFRWAQDKGCTTRVAAATFGDGVRGLMPLHGDLQPGDCALTVPADLIITSTTAWQSDLGAVLAKIPDLPDDTAALIWTLVDSKDDESPWQPFWDSLPQEFNTGLSAPESAVAALEGAPALGELMQARLHLQKQYMSIQPVLTALLQAYSSSIKPEWFTWERFVWAAELWYAYAIQIEFPDGTRSSGLVPLASLMNHSPTPHVVRFSLVDKESNCLQLCPFRSCPEGHQCLLSYGPLPNAQLLIFYGFALPNNPFDVFFLSLEIADEDPCEQQKKELFTRLSIPLDHNLRPPPASLPAHLLDCIRIIIADEEAVRKMTVDAGGSIWKGGPVDEENEAAAQSVLVSTLEDLMEPFQSGLSEVNAENTHPFALAARTYMAGQLEILSHALQLCQQL